MLKRGQSGAMMFMDRTLYHLKWAAMEELRGALKLKEINEELLDQLASGLQWLIHYSSKYQIPLPELDKISALIDRTMAIADKIDGLTVTSSDELLQSDKKKESDVNETEPFRRSQCKVTRAPFERFMVSPLYLIATLH
jgi:hypothetical protein